MQLKRNVFHGLRNDQNSKTVSILLGPRQVGKSTLLRKLESDFKKQGLKTSFFDLEQPRDLILFNKDDQEIIDFLKEQGDIVLIDEFHYLKNASKILKAIYDSHAQLKIYASGSSSIEIHKHLKESMAGRKRTYRIFPLTFEECLPWNPSLERFLIYGGMPGLVHETTDQDAQALLSEIVKSYILKDIRSLLKEENIRAFNHMLYFLAQNQGSVISNASLAREIGLSVKAVHHYLSILKETFVVYILPSYSKNQANELKKSQKIYFYDLGIRNSLLQNFAPSHERSDRGLLYESFVLLNAMPKLEENMSITFWRTRLGDEVDFILLKNRVPIPIEVKTNWVENKIPDNLLKFISRYPETKTAFVISNHSFDCVTSGKTKVYFKSFLEFDSVWKIIGS